MAESNLMVLNITLQWERKQWTGRNTKAINVFLRKMHNYNKAGSRD